MSYKSTEVLSLIETITENQNKIESLKNTNLILSEQLKELKAKEKISKLQESESKYNERMQKLQDKMNRLAARKASAVVITKFDAEGNICNDIADSLREKQEQKKLDI